ncbi:hypothetical protein LUZ62_062145 [Rhynchospora pubera]|uniref:Uncharacterized protein n=1 Tax=Rhynchospora pubera TaxID=906938 RepID=A0AAV8EI69_9POAL|nr:hypothetical protein LUZ62_062145 [Rhynchospora pubera]
METANTTSPTPACTVQHVTKASSDELLRKFADPDSPSPRRHLPLALKRKKSSRRVASGLSARELAGTGSDVSLAVKRRRSGGSAEWKAGLLLPTTTARKSNGSLARRMGIGRIDDAIGISIILAALERTWQKTVANASKVFVEKHRTNHVRLISDMV